MNRIKELRNKKGITLKELSGILNEKYLLKVSDGQLSNYENGKRSPRSSKIWDSLAEFFEVPVSYLLGLDKDRTPIADTNSFGEYDEETIKLLAKLNKDTDDTTHVFLKTLIEKFVLIRENKEDNLDYEFELNTFRILILTIYSNYIAELIQNYSSTNSIDINEMVIPKSDLVTEEDRKSIVELNKILPFLPVDALEGIINLENTDD
mgnify:CR=1 FL=1